MELFQTIKRVGIFVICAQAVLHFKPAARYEKYLKLLVSIMVLAQLLTPIMHVFSMETKENFEERVFIIREEMEQKMEELEIENRIQEKNVLQQTEKEIKSRINNIAKKYELTVVVLQTERADLKGKFLVYVKERAESQDIAIHIDQISTDSEAVDKAEQEEKLQMLSNEIATELGIEKKEIEVLWYG